MADSLKNVDNDLKVFRAEALARIDVANKQSPHPVDQKVGNRLRVARTLRGVSQEQLARAVGLTFQQVQKYEKGANRISASRLWEFSTLLGKDPSWFFESDAYEDERFHNEPLPIMNDSDDKLIGRDVLELVREWRKIDDERIRQKIIELIRVTANSELDDA